MSLYGSFSYFSGKATAANLTLLNSSIFLKLFIEKNALKDNIRLQLGHVDGTEVKTNDKKINDFSITKLRKRKKVVMSEPVGTIIIRAQQNFDVVGGLNSIQIEIEDDRITNILKKYKNAVYKITALDVLFPATVTNNTNQIFITAKELNGLKKGFLNNKLYNLLAVNDLNKINNRAEVKGNLFGQVLLLRITKK